MGERKREREREMGGGGELGNVSIYSLLAQSS